MKKNIVLLLSAFLCVTLFCSQGFAQSQPSEIRQEICKTLTYYFNGFELNDTEALTKAYHEQARFTMMEPEGQSYTYLEFGAYLSAIASHPPKTMERTLSVRQLEWTGNVAYVHAVIEYAGRGHRIHDFLLLQKTEETWKIINRTSVKEFASFDGGMESEKLSRSELYELESGIGRLVKNRRVNDGYLLSAFADHGDVSFVDPRLGILTRLDLEGYENLLETQPATKRKKEEIEWLHVSSSVVVLKMKTRVPSFGCHLVDYMTLVNNNGEWEIVHKATHKPDRAISVTP